MGATVKFSGHTINDVYDLSVVSKYNSEFLSIECHLFDGSVKKLQFDKTKYPNVKVVLHSNLYGITSDNYVKVKGNVKSAIVSESLYVNGNIRKYSCYRGVEEVSNAGEEYKTEGRNRIIHIYRNLHSLNTSVDNPNFHVQIEGNVDFMAIENNSMSIKGNVDYCKVGNNIKKKIELKQIRGTSK